MCRALSGRDFKSVRILLLLPTMQAVLFHIVDILMEKIELPTAQV